MIRLLAWVGFVRIRDGKIRWPFGMLPFRMWRTLFFPKGSHKALQSPVGIFRNRPNVVKWQKGRLLPRRWGFWLLGFEFGDRGG